MPPENPKPRFLRLFGGDARADAGLTRSALDEGALWAAHEKAAAAAADSGHASQRIASHIAKQRNEVDTLSDRGRAMAERASELLASVGRVVDAFARLELVALNTGLEGARMNGAAAHALGLVSDEVRAQTTRGTEAARELASGLGEIRSELTVVNANLERAREGVAEVADEAARVGVASVEMEHALADIGHRLRTSGSDPETARAIEQAAEHARALVTALGALSTKVPQSLLMSALRPVLEPLSRMFEGDENET